MTTRLRILGFVEADQSMLSDKPIAGLTYLTRVYGGQHQYVSLCSHEGRFCEAVFHVYAAAFNPKARGKRAQLEQRGGAPIYANIARSWEDLEPMLSVVYKVPV